jgi:hypothetical protein
MTSIVGNKKEERTFVNIQLRLDPVRPGPSETFSNLTNVSVDLHKIYYAVLNAKTIEIHGTTFYATLKA